MQLDEYLQQVQDQLRAAATLGDDRTQQIAASLASAVDSSVRLAILAAVSAAAAEISSLLGEGGGPAVTASLDGDDIRFDVAGASAEPAAEPAADDGEATARISLRLSEKLKADIEDAASRDGISVNAWLVRAATSALSRPTGPFGGWPGPWSGGQHGRGTRRVTGWVTG